MADERDDAASGWRKAMLRLKKIAACPVAEQEDLLQTFARDLRETQPLIAEKIVQWNRDGFSSSRRLYPHSGPLLAGVNCMPRKNENCC
jgi:hypothetical protein